jgi:hypothetical protein
MEKLPPQVRILIHKGDWSETVTADAYCITDVIGGYLVPQSGDGANAETSSGNKSLDALQWQGQRAFERVDASLDLITLDGDGGVTYGIDAATKHNDRSVATVCGFVVRPYRHTHNFVMDRRLAGDPKPQNSLREMGNIGSCSFALSQCHTSSRW